MVHIKKIFKKKKREIESETGEMGQEEFFFFNLFLINLFFIYGCTRSLLFCAGFL